MNIITFIENLFAEYGYYVLLIGLPLDAIALPIPPGNTTLTYTGYLAYKGILSLGIAWLAAFAGSVIGLSVTYHMGYKLGQPLIERYGKWLFLKPEHLEKSRKYYEKYGDKMLLIGCFIPGVRQILGYFSGIIRVPFAPFALFGYIGSALWVSAFIGIGYLFGDQWQAVMQLVETYLKYIFGALGLAGLLYLLLLWRRRRNGRRAAAISSLKETEKLKIRKRGTE